MISTKENKDARLILQHTLVTSTQQSCVGLPRSNSPSAASEEAKTPVCSSKTAILIFKKRGKLEWWRTTWFNTINRGDTSQVQEEGSMTPECTQPSCHSRAQGDRQGRRLQGQLGSFLENCLMVKSSHWEWRSQRAWHRGWWEWHPSEYWAEKKQMRGLGYRKEMWLPLETRMHWGRGKETEGAILHHSQQSPIKLLKSKICSNL